MNCNDEKCTFGMANTVICHKFIVGWFCQINCSNLIDCVDIVIQQKNTNSTQQMIIMLKTMRKWKDHQLCVPDSDFINFVLNTVFLLIHIELKDLNEAYIWEPT